MDDIEIINEKIKIKHSNDEKQLEAIFSSEKRLLIEAPAGYGKTNTMASKIAYLLLTNQISYPKKILALTFSVNAAYKIKKDILKNVPVITEGTNYKTNINDKIVVSNYHGFARRLLKRSGYKIDANFLEIDIFKTIDDTKMEDLLRAFHGLTVDEGELMSNFNKAVKNFNKTSLEFLKKNINDYNSIVVSKIIPSKTIPYNAILTIALMLLRDDKVIRDFYQRLFTVVLADEFQDTNILSYWLLSNLISEDTKLILLGDSLQRIYGFIGAIPKLFSIAESQFLLSKIVLNKNYRFSGNKEMLLLDNNLRRNAEDPQNPTISEMASIQYSELETQEDEAVFVVDMSLRLIKDNPDKKIAILTKQRGHNINKIMDEFNKRSESFFFGLFTDDDPEYQKFNKICSQEFSDLLEVSSSITKKFTTKLIDKVKSKYSKDQNIFIDSLFQLLKVFLSRIFTDTAFLSNDEKINLIKETFEYNGLKQCIEFVNSNIVISTIHGAKGLEWDFVILPDMEKFYFPNRFGLCRVCKCESDCCLIVDKNIETKFLEELSVFYVAVTRARKQVYFTSSKKQIDNNGDVIDTSISCYLKLPGVSFI